MVNQHTQDSSTRRLRLIEYGLLLVTLLAPWGLAVWFGPEFETNDDAANIVLLRQVYGEGSLDSSIFLSVPLARLLGLLYATLPEVPWYSGLVLGCLLLAQVVLLTAVLRTPRPFWQRGLACAVAACSWVYLGLFPSFTAAALATAGAGLLIVVQARSRGLLSLGLALVVLGWALRPDTLPVVLACGVPMAAGSLLSGALPLRRLAIRLGGVLILLALLAGGDRLLHSPQTLEFEAYNRHRAQFSDFAFGRLAADRDAVLAAADWSMADYLVARALWWFADEQVHGRESLARFLEANEAPLHSLGWTPGTFRANLAARWPELLLCVTLMAAALWSGAGRRTWLPLLLALGLVVFLCGVRFPPRIAVPVLLLVGLVPLFWSGTPRNEGRPIRPGFWMVGAGVLLSAWAVSGFIDHARFVKVFKQTGRVTLVEARRQVAQRSPQPVVYVPLAAGRYWGELDFMAPFREHDWVPAFPVGWMAQGPVRTGALRQLGLDPTQPTVPQLLAHPGVIYYALVDAATAGEVPRVFLGYLNRHYGAGAGQPALSAEPAGRLEAGSLQWIFFRVRPVGAG